MTSTRTPMEYFQKNSQKFSEKYKDKWLAVSGTRIEANSKTFAEIAEFANSFAKTTIIVKIPKNPNAIQFY